MLVPTGAAAAAETPTAQATLDPATPDGNNDWYVAPVSLTLSSDDNDAALRWRASGDEDWVDYSDPVSFAQDGSYEVEYQAVVAGESAPTTASVVAGPDGNDIFSPDDVVVEVGGTVTYTRESGFHNVVIRDAGNNVLDESEMNASWSTWEFTPTEPGEYTFVCIPHESQGMVGTLTVLPPAEDAESEVGVVSFDLDQAAPQTTATIDGEGAGSVYIDQVSVTLDAQDATSGVARTEYRLAGGSAQVYDGPMDFTDAGEHTVEFRSTDQAGNVEDWQQVTFAVVVEDPEAPSVSASLDPATPDGENGWYTSVALLLSSDNDDAELLWRYAGVHAWSRYTDPVAFGRDGNLDLEYRAATGWVAPRVVDVEVGAGGNYFTPDVISVLGGGTINYELIAGRHNVVTVDAAGNELATSGVPTNDWDTYTFAAPDEVGTYYVYCAPHSNTSDPDPANWTGMVARIDVTDDAESDEVSSQVRQLSLKRDSTPPRSSVTVDGVRDGEVYLDQVTVSFSARDSASGVAETHWRSEGETSYEVYEETLTFVGAGTSTIEYRSVDNAGNVEDWRTVVFEVASSLPVCDVNQGSASFPDAPGSGHQYFIDCLAALEIVGGFDDGTYRPASAVTRGQLASFVVRAIETITGTELEVGDERFPDVALGSTHGRAIYKLRNAGVIQGYADGTFRPAAEVSRDQTARYVVNALESQLGEGLPTSGARFPDVTSSQYVDDIDKLVTAEIIGGFADGTFGPRLSVTRGQMARFIGNSLDLLPTG